MSCQHNPANMVAITRASSHVAVLCGVDVTVRTAGCFVADRVSTIMPLCESHNVAACPLSSIVGVPTTSGHMTPQHITAAGCNVVLRAGGYDFSLTRLARSRAIACTISCVGKAAVLV